MTLLVILAGSLGGWLWYLNHLGNNVQRIHNVFVADKKRPGKVETDALNILLGGSDNGADGQSIAQTSTQDTGRPERTGPTRS